MYLDCNGAPIVEGSPLFNTLEALGRLPAPAARLRKPRSRPLVRKLLDARRLPQSVRIDTTTYQPAGYTEGKRGRGKPPVQYLNRLPFFLHLLQRIEPDLFNTISLIPDWLDDIIAGSLVWGEGKSTAHKLSPFWMKRIVTELPVITSAGVVQLTGLSRRAAQMYVSNATAACELALMHAAKLYSPTTFDGTRTAGTHHDRHDPA